MGCCKQWKFLLSTLEILDQEGIPNIPPGEIIKLMRQLENNQRLVGLTVDPPTGRTADHGARI